MNGWKRFVALAPALLAAGGCGHLGDWTRRASGLDQNPVRTEYNGVRPSRSADLYRAGYEARQRLVAAIGALVEPPPHTSNESGDDVADRAARATEQERTRAQEVFRRSEQFYHLGRLAMRSQCESFMQTLATVDGQTTFGRDLANNFFDTATVAATISGSPSVWATGLAATQNSFNSISGSTERFLLLTESVGALRERVIARMEENEGSAPDFARYLNDSGEFKGEISAAQALALARESIEAVQRYGAPCTEAGIRMIIAEALGGDGFRQDATRAREQSYVDAIRSIINTDIPENTEPYGVSDQELRWLYVWAIIGSNASGEEDRRVRHAVETRLTYLGNLKAANVQRLSYFVQQLALQREEISSDVEGVRRALLQDQGQNQSDGAPDGGTPGDQTPPN